MPKQPLTEQEENVVKDILQMIGRDDNVNREFAKACGLTTRKFNFVTDSAFKKLGNGRLIVSEG